MSRFDEQYISNHQRQKSLVLVMSLLGLVLAVAPRQERALFITPGMNPAAFVAAFPPINLATLHGILGGETGTRTRDTPSAFFARTPPRPTGGSPFVSAPPEGTAGTPGSSSPELVSGTPGDTVSFTPAVVPASGNGGGLPFTPVSFTQPNADPIVGGGVPAATPTPTPTVTTTPVPVAAVPEPATWLTMIVGFFVVGAGLRRRRAFRLAGAASL